MNLKFSGKGIAFLIHYAAKADVRIYLSGIRVIPMPAESGGGALGIASNGHVLAMWHDKDGQASRPATLNISEQLAKACGKRINGEATDLTLTLRDNRLACVAGDQEIYIQPNPLTPKGVGPRDSADGLEPWEIFGKYPEFSRVIPGLEKCNNWPSDYVNPHYLWLIAKSLPDVKLWGAGVRMLQEGRGAPILITQDETPEIAIVLMPMSDRPESPGSRDWLRRFKAHETRRLAAATVPLPVYETSDAGPPDGDGRGWAFVNGGAL